MKQQSTIRLLKSLCFLLLVTHPLFCGISVVYNFRIANITRQPIVKPKNDHPYTLSGLLFDTYQKSYIGEFRENYTGGLATFIYNFSAPYYIRTDVAVSQINQSINHVPNFSAIEPDDILFTFGRNFQLNKKSRVTLSGLFGIPTHPVFTLQSIPFGSGQVGTGIQLDGLQTITKKVDFLWGARYNYFFPRKTQDILGNNYKFSIGSIADLILALQGSWSIAHGVEGGYASRWGFNPKACPEIPILSKILTYQRNNFYFVYKYTLFTKRVAHRLILNIAYGYDTKPKEFGFAHAITVWGSWGINF